MMEATRVQPSLSLLPLAGGDEPGDSRGPAKALIDAARAGEPTTISLIRRAFAATPSPASGREGESR